MVRWLAEEVETPRRWFDAPAASEWRRQESALLGEILPHLVGYRCLCVGTPADVSAAYAGTLRFWQADVRARGPVDVCIDTGQMPWATGSIDALILVHALEFSTDPHGVIRECARVLSDRGQLVCLAFNPLSVWALRQRLSSASGRFRPRSVPPRAARLTDWLRLLDFERMDCWRYGPGWPLLGRRWQSGRGRRWLAPVAWSAPGYALFARRQTLQRLPSSARTLWAGASDRGLASPRATGVPSGP